MPGATLKQQLNNFVRFMRDQGILDQHFENVRVLQNEGNPGFVMQLIQLFMNDAETAIAEITTNLNASLVDYGRLISLVHKLRGGSSNIGGCRMALACRDLRQACDIKDKARCVELFQRVKEEYQLLHENLSHISAMEQAILEYETGTRGGGLP